MLLYRFTCGALILAQLALQEELSAEFACSGKSCYAVYWISKRFPKSVAACEEKKGNLMTVKNSSQAGAIALFLEKVRKDDARVWIGMAPKDTCTDLQQPLRGFAWVTGDSDTDYTNWKNDEQKCDALPLCVTVRKDGKWEETSCNYKADGYLCEISYSFSCSSLNLSSSLVTYYHPDLGMGHSADSVFPPGTFAEISTDPDITRLSCAENSDGSVTWSREAPGAWSCDIENGGCELECSQVSAIAECKCPPGSELKADLRTCTKPCDPSPCSQHCAPDPPGFYCMCDAGYTLAADEKTCEDIDDCAANPNICDHHCTNTIGGFVCDCNPGFEMHNVTCDGQCDSVTDCQDIDECEKNMCEQICENYPGGYKCVCHEGFLINENDGNKCKKVCNTSVCQPDCEAVGKPCSCPNGFILDQTEDGVNVCTDVDECLASPCDWLCINTVGSYICCPEGYTIHSDVCIQPTEAPHTPSPTSRPADMYSLQPTIMWGICSGVLSMFIVLIAMMCHRIRRHYIYKHDLEYNYKNTDKDVVLKKIMMEPQWRL